MCYHYNIYIVIDYYRSILQINMETYTGIYIGALILQQN